VFSVVINDAFVTEYYKGGTDPEKQIRSFIGKQHLQIFFITQFSITLCGSDPKDGDKIYTSPIWVNDEEFIKHHNLLRNYFQFF
jgi:hypothetical protein